MFQHSKRGARSVVMKRFRRLKSLVPQQDQPKQVKLRHVRALPKAIHQAWPWVSEAMAGWIPTRSKYIQPNVYSLVILARGDECCKSNVTSWKHSIEKIHWAIHNDAEARLLETTALLGSQRGRQRKKGPAHQERHDRSQAPSLFCFGLVPKADLASLLHGKRYTCAVCGGQRGERASSAMCVVEAPHRVCLFCKPSVKKFHPPLVSPSFLRNACAWVWYEY
jgi:hypothetical protein